MWTPGCFKQVFGVTLTAPKGAKWGPQNGTPFPLHHPDCWCTGGLRISQGSQGQPLLAWVLPAAHRGLAGKPQGPSCSESPLPNPGLSAADKVNNGGGAQGHTALSETHADNTLTTSDSAAGSGRPDPGWARHKPLHLAVLLWEVSWQPSTVVKAGKVRGGTPAHSGAFGRGPNKQKTRARFRKPFSLSLTHYHPQEESLKKKLLICETI